MESMVPFDGKEPIQRYSVNEDRDMHGSIADSEVEDNFL